jgi:hypothetical protein
MTCPQAGRGMECIMRHDSERGFELRNGLQSFVEDNCGCGVETRSDHVTEACDDAALMLQQEAR